MNSITDASGRSLEGGAILFPGGLGRNAGLKSKNTAEATWEQGGIQAWQMMLGQLGISQQAEPKQADGSAEDPSADATQLSLEGESSGVQFFTSETNQESRLLSQDRYQDSAAGQPAMKRESSVLDQRPDNRTKRVEDGSVPFTFLKGRALKSASHSDGRNISSAECAPLIGNGAIVQATSAAAPQLAMLPSESMPTVRGEQAEGLQLIGEQRSGRLLPVDAQYRSGASDGVSRHLPGVAAGSAIPSRAEVGRPVSEASSGLLDSSFAKVDDQPSKILPIQSVDVQTGNSQRREDEARAVPANDAEASFAQYGSTHAPALPTRSRGRWSGRPEKIAQILKDQPDSTGPTRDSGQRSVLVACTDTLRGSQQTRFADSVEIPNHPHLAGGRQADVDGQQWTQVGKRFAEAGFEDPSLGWVSVRAERDNTGLHAVLVPASHEAGRMLSAHLSGLNTHLNENHIQVWPVTISAAHDMELSSSLGNDSQGGNSYRREQGSDESRGSVSSRQTDEVAKARAPNDANHFDPSQLRWRASGANGAHISLVA